MLTCARTFDYYACFSADVSICTTNVVLWFSNQFFMFLFSFSFLLFSYSVLWKLKVYCRDTWLINAEEVSYTLIACKNRARTRTRKKWRRKTWKINRIRLREAILQLNCNCNSIRRPNRTRISANPCRETKLNWELCLWAKIDVPCVQCSLSVFNFEWKIEIYCKMLIFI